MKTRAFILTGLIFLSACSVGPTYMLMVKPDTGERVVCEMPVSSDYPYRPVSGAIMAEINPAGRSRMNECIEQHKAIGFVPVKQ